MKYEIENLDFDISLEELEQIEKAFRSDSYNYPVLHITKNNIISFNILASTYVPDRIKWFCNSEYIFGFPGDKHDENTFSVVSSRLYSGSKTTTFPSVMRNEKKVKDGFYKCFKCKDGIAFKRYEQIKLNV